MTGIEWLFGPPTGGVAEGTEGWLSAAELERLARFRVPKRRSEWLLGRFTSKTLVAGVLARGGGSPPLASFEIVPGPTGAPFVRDPATGERLPVAVSISHSTGRSLAAARPDGPVGSPRWTVGADLEWIEPRSDGFVRDFLTQAERAELAALPAAERPARANGIWSAKEAVLKTLGLGLTVDTWKVECLLEPREFPDAGPVVPAGTPWRRFSAVCAPEILPAGPAPAFLGFWREEAGFVLTLAAASL